MIFIANADGSIKAALPSNVYQNSNLANRVVLFAPFTSATKVSVAFNLPNGNNTARLLTQQDAIEMSKYDIASSELAENYSMWFYDLPQMITSVSGDVSVQFFIYNGTQTIATSSQIFNVYNGIDYIEENINDDQYSELLNLVSGLEALVDNLNNTTVKKENVATINGQSIINGGNVEINSLTEEEKEKLDKIVIDGDGDKYLADDGTYKEVAGGSSVTVDSELSDTSTNPVENKVITTALNQKVNSSDVATINGQKITEGGNIVIEGGSGGTIEVDAELSTESENPVQNKVVTEALDNKLDKITNVYQVYCTDGKGEQITRTCAWSATSGNIPLYDNNGGLGGYNDDDSVSLTTSGALITAIPYKPKHATPKKWVEDLVETNKGTKIYKHTVTGHIENTGDGLYFNVEFYSFSENAQYSIYHEPTTCYLIIESDTIFLKGPFCGASAVDPNVKVNTLGSGNVVVDYSYCEIELSSAWDWAGAEYVSHTIEHEVVGV